MKEGNGDNGDNGYMVSTRQCTIISNHLRGLSVYIFVAPSPSPSPSHSLVPVSFFNLCLFPGLSLSRCTCSSDRIFVKDEVEERFVLFHDIHYPPKVLPKSIPQKCSPKRGIDE